MSPTEITHRLLRAAVAIEHRVTPDLANAVHAARTATGAQLVRVYAYLDEQAGAHEVSLAREVARARIAEARGHDPDAAWASAREIAARVRCQPPIRATTPATAVRFSSRPTLE